MKKENKRNSKKNYKKGARRKIISLLLINGALPAKGLSLLSDNTETAYRKIKEMEKEGLLVINKYQDTWLITLKTYSEKLVTELSPYFDSRYFEYYESYGREAAKRAKCDTTPRKKEQSEAKEDAFTLPFQNESPDEWGYEEYTDNPIEQNILNEAMSADCNISLSKEDLKKIKAKKSKIQSSRRSTLRRVVRNGETLMFIDGLPLSYSLDKKPELNSPESDDLRNSFYTPHELNTVALAYSEASIPSTKTYKFQGARHNGLIISEGGSYIIYNSSKWGMQVNRGFEQNLVSFTDSLLQNHNHPYLDGCIRLFSNESLLLSLMEKKTIKVGNRLEKNEPEWINCIEDYYRHVYVLPLNKNGQTIASIMCTPSWRDKITQVFYKGLQSGHKNCKIELHIEELKHKHNDGYMFYCNDVKGTSIHHRAISLHFFIPDIKKLRYFIDAIKYNGSYDESGNFVPDERYEIYCFDFQKPALMTYAGKYATIKSVKFSKFYEVYSTLFLPQS